jgi:hypothetical protein
LPLAAKFGPAERLTSLSATSTLPAMWNEPDIRAGNAAFFESGSFTFLNNPDAQIGSVTIGGNWTASELGAGTYNRTGDRYNKLTIAGVPDSSRRLAKIGSIAIGGSVRGTSAAGDNFGFIAEEIGRVRIGGSDRALVPGPSN